MYNYTDCNTVKQLENDDAQSDNDTVNVEITENEEILESTSAYNACLQFENESQSSDSEWLPSDDDESDDDDDDDEYEAAEESEEEKVQSTSYFTPLRNISLTSDIHLINLCSTSHIHPTISIAMWKFGQIESA